MTSTATVKVSTRGRVGIPKAIRDRVGLRRGEKITLEHVDGALLVRRGSDTPDPSTVISFHHDPHRFAAWLEENALRGYFLVVSRDVIHRAGCSVHVAGTRSEVLCTRRLHDLVDELTARGIKPTRCRRCEARGPTEGLPVRLPSP